MNRLGHLQLRHHIVRIDGRDQPFGFEYRGATKDDPALAVLVKIDEPKDVPWGTVVAAPSFGRLVQEALAYLKVPPTGSALVSTIQ